MEWDSGAIQQLRDDWSAGFSTAEIGRRIGVSKNAIIGKVHRLDLEARPSPIHRRAGSVPPAPKYIPIEAPKLPPLPSLQAPPPPVSTPPPLPTPIVAKPIAMPAKPIPLPTPRPITRRCPSECCWPIGQVGTTTFRFCRDDSLPGRPYCDEHAKLAYVKIRDRREDIA